MWFLPGRLAAAALFVAAVFLGPAEAQITNAPTTNLSVTITAGNTFQTVLAALGLPPAIRRSLTIQNNQATGTDLCWIYIGPLGSATKPTSIVLAVGVSYTRYFPYIPSDAIQATCATTGDSLYVDVQ